MTPALAADLAALAVHSPALAAHYEVEARRLTGRDLAELHLRVRASLAARRAA